MPPKAILFLDQYAGLSGGQKVLLDIASAFAKKKRRVIVGLPGAGMLAERLQRLSIETCRLPIGSYTITRKSIFDLINYAVRLPVLAILTCYLIKKENIALVYANGARTYPWATIACSIMRTPLVWHVHSIFSGRLERSSCLFFGKARCLARIFAVSEASARPLAALKNKIMVIHNAIDADAKPQTSDTLRLEYNVDRSVFCAAAIGILERWKNQEDLIRAAAILKSAAIGPFRFFLIGDSLRAGSNKDAYKQRLKDLVVELSVSNEVVFTGSRRDVRALLPSLNALVICSRTPDPCPLVALEAAAAGVAIISTDFGGVREMFAQNEEALFYQAEEIRQLADTIASLIKEPDMARRLGTKARTKVLRDYRLDAFLKKIIDTTDAIN